MDLLAHLKQHGQTFTVSNIKGDGHLSTKVVSLATAFKVKETKVKKEVVARPIYELRSLKDSFFEFNSSIMTKLPELNNEGIGFAIINDPVNKKVYLYLCGKENDLKATPKIMNNLKGKKKSLKFKSAAFLYFGIQANLFTDEAVTYKLAETDIKNLFDIVVYTPETATNQLDLFIPVATVEADVKTFEEEEVEVPGMNDELDAEEIEEDDIDDNEEEDGEWIEEAMDDEDEDEIIAEVEKELVSLDVDDDMFDYIK
jgi:hypothetical protein